MTSLAEVYEDRVGEAASLRRLYAGTALFLAGAVMVVVAILMATTSVPEWFGMARNWQGWEVAGVLAGLGIPAVFLGVFAVLPASDHLRAAAAIGASVAVLGVAFFLYAFPHRWHGDPTNLTLPVVAVYSFGALVTFWCLFVAVANFKTRNDPGGTVTLEIKQEGGVRTVEVTKSDLKKGDLGPLGSVGVFGNLPEDEPTADERPTKTSRASTSRSDSRKTGRDSSRRSNAGRSGGGSTRRSSRGSIRRSTPQSTRRQPVGASPTSDGGTEPEAITSPLDHDYDDATVIDAPRPAVQQAGDTYCGNCRYFEYVRTERGMVPYCGFYTEEMDDMEACDRWEPNTYR